MPPARRSPPRAARSARERSRESCRESRGAPAEPWTARTARTCSLDSTSRATSGPGAPTKGDRMAGGAPCARPPEAAAGTLSEAGRVTDHVIPAVGEVAGRVRAPPGTGATGDVGAAVVGRVERAAGDDDERVLGIGVDRDPLAGCGAAR